MDIAIIVLCMELIGIKLPYLVRGVNMPSGNLQYNRLSLSLEDFGIKGCFKLERVTYYCLRIEQKSV